MASKTVFSKILDSATKSGLLKSHTLQSLNWFRQKLTNFRATIKQEAQNKNRGKLPPARGQLFLFEYKAKTYPHRLRYYDRYPLVLILSWTHDGFIGLNFHYLPPNLRAQLFQQLLKLEKEDFKTERNKIQVTYKMLDTYARYNLFRPCIKRYLASHVGQTFVRIESHEWEAALFLPTEQFIGATKQQVWNDSRDIIKKNQS